MVTTGLGGTRLRNQMPRQGEPHLVYRGVHVLGVGGGHGLNTNRMLAPHCHVTNHDGARFPTNCFVDRVGVLLARHCARNENGRLGWGP